MGHVPIDAKWYLAVLIMEITVSRAKRNVVHRNLVLIRADSPNEAYEKAIGSGRKAETSYNNPKGQSVRIRFKGVAKLEVLYEDLEDGAELTFEEHVGVSRQKIKRWIPSKEQLNVFVPPNPGRKHNPDYRSKVVLDKVAKLFGSKRVVQSE